jgi:Family of unknown function (DUF6632)
MEFLREGGPAGYGWSFCALHLFGGWRWPPYNAIYDQMIVSIYVAVGACSLWAPREPLKHASFLWFVVLSSTLHGSVRLFHAIHDPTNVGHLIRLDPGSRRGAGDAPVARSKKGRCGLEDLLGKGALRQINKSTALA